MFLILYLYIFISLYLIFLLISFRQFQLISFLRDPTSIPRYFGSGLSAEAEFRNYFSVTLNIIFLDIVKHPTTPSNQTSVSLFGYGDLSYEPLDALLND